MPSFLSPHPPNPYVSAFFSLFIAQCFPKSLDVFEKQSITFLFSKTYLPTSIHVTIIYSTRRCQRSLVTNYQAFVGRYVPIRLQSTIEDVCNLCPAVGLWIYLAVSEEQDQTAHTCSLILLCTLRCSINSPYQRNSYLMH